MARLLGVLILICFAASASAWKSRYGIDALRKHPLKVLRTGVTTVLVGLGPFLGPSDALARNAASEKFSEAEVAMAETIQAYKGAKTEWTLTAKKLVDASKQDLGQGKSTTSKLVADATALQAKVNALVGDEAAQDAKVAAEISALQQSTALKYQAAETAALPESKKRPAYTAALFAAAADQAAILGKTENLLASYRETEATTATSLARLGASIGEASAVVNTITAVENALQSATAQLVEGVAPAMAEITLIEPVSASASAGGGGGTASSSSSGARLFSAGASAVESETARAATALRTLSSTCKSLTAVEEELTRSALRLGDVQTKTAAWEKETKLSPKVAVGAIKSTESQLASLSKQAAALSTKACDAYDKVDLADKNKLSNNNKNKKQPSLSSSLRDVIGRLEYAEKRARDTEALIKTATQRGQEEASRYRKFIPVASSSSSSLTDGSMSKPPVIAGVQ